MATTETAKTTYTVVISCPEKRDPMNKRQKLHGMSMTVGESDYERARFILESWQNALNNTSDSDPIGGVSNGPGRSWSDWEAHIQVKVVTTRTVDMYPDQIN